ncbi:MAG: T9SS type A sorting domain-containing protein [Bacteroidota bacterium]|nr:T9SS type A sorting domain-containing protein [Bacteroidota bacterium]
MVDQAGEYSVQLTLANGYCNWYDTIHIFYQDMNYFENLDTIICPGDSLLVELDPSFAYLWGNGSTDNCLYNIVPSSYLLTVTLSNCTIEDTLELSPDFYPLPITVLPDDTTKCPGISLTLNGGNEQTYNYLWSNGFVTDTVAIDSLGLHTLLITDTIGCTIIDSVWVTDQEEAIANFNFFEAFNHVQFTNQSQNSYWYTWNFGDGSPLSYQTNPEHNYPVLNQNMWYTATLISTNQCGADTSFLQIFTFDIEEIGENPNIQIYPNPNKGTFFLTGNLASKDDLRIQIFNSIGQVIYQKKISNFDGQLSEEIKMRQVVPGIYYLKVQQKEKNWVWKLVVEQ